MFKDMKNQIFHKLDEPFFLNPYGVNSGISALHDLYPGRPMTVDDSFLNKYAIPNEDPEGAKRTFLNSRKETKEYAKMLIDSVVSDNGGDENKVLIHALDDPSSVINDPDLKSAQMMTPESIGEGSPLPHPPNIRGPIVEGYQGPDEETFDPFIKNIILASIIMFALVFLIAFLRK